MKFFKTSKAYYLNKSTYVNLRWIAIIGQFITVNSVKFIFNFEYNYFLANFIVFLGALSNLFLIYFYNKPQISNRSSFNFLFIDIIQLSFLFYLSGGVLNPFSIFLLIPSVFSSSNLDIRTNLTLILVTILSIIFLTFFYKDLPYPLNKNIIVNEYYYYAIPLALIIALIFLNYFAMTFGRESRLRKEALDKIQEVIAKEHELVSLGGQAAAAAHSLGTPLSTIKIISQELLDQFKVDEDINKDLKLLVSQVERCNEILKKLTLNPTIEDDFIDKDLSLVEYVDQIVKSFKKISDKKFIVNLEQNSNSFQIRKSIEIVYGIRNFIGNANKFSKEKIYITLKSDSENSEIIIEDDGEGYPKDILNKIGEPYIKSLVTYDNSKSGLGLGIFIGKTLLEKNRAELLCRNSKTRGGAEVNIIWNNKDLIQI
ncbi:MAG: ActS/PrrB/RegB family redox-sensitive histidine kinase [Candidatus Pelagibacter bacterium]|jgi:two-component system sensor histidine kinase RegB|nr:ActS/PrrB/RegB family redox-sensitive histidine kinase [Candidatus Pelagibacter bacterium]